MLLFGQQCIVFLILFLTKNTFSKCVNSVCDNINNFKYEKNDEKFVYFEHFYPVNLVYLEEDSFLNHNNLEFISIKRLINDINKNAFQNLKKLNTVLLVDNIIKEIPKDLFKNNQLQKLLIRNCKLTTIKNLQSISTLLTLKIQNNNIVSINKCFPSNLLELNLKQNNIKTIEENSFENLKKLQILDLSNNNIIHFDFETYLIHNKKLKSIHMSYNNIQQISQLPTLQKLKYLYLDNNNITKMNINTFKNILRIEILNLSNNKLSEISKNVFKNKYTYLNKLYINNNNLKCINVELFSFFPNLKIIWYGNNNYNCNCYNKIQQYLSTSNITTMYYNENEMYCI